MGMLAWASKSQVCEVGRGGVYSEMNADVYYARVYALAMAQRDAMTQRCFAMLKEQTG
jgi:hypothetical protein